MTKFLKNTRFALLLIVIASLSFFAVIATQDSDISEYVENTITPTEILEACWEHHTAVYSNGCVGNQILWDPNRFPLAVSIDYKHHSSFTLSDAEIIVEAAITDFNHQVGFEALRYVEFDFLSAPIIINWGVDLKKETYLGTTNHYQRLQGTRFVLFSKINIGVEVNASNAYNTTLHELGHAIGLNHDTSTSSLMYPTVSFVPVTLEKDDVQIIRQLYFR